MLLSVQCVSDYCISMCSVCLCAECFYMFSVLVCVFSVFMIVRCVSSSSACFRLTPNVRYPNILPIQTSAMAGGP